MQDCPEVWLNRPAWSVLTDQVTNLAQLCRDRGFEVAFHPHGGSYVETPEEVARLFNDTDREVLGLCLDTGHCFFGGGNPLDLIRDLGHALRLVHLKDVDLNVLGNLKDEGFGLEEAWRRGVFCELGQGGVDLIAVLSELHAQNYKGWLVVEQDRILRPGQTLVDARIAAESNRSFLLQHDL